MACGICFVYSIQNGQRESAASASLLQVEGGWMWMVGVGGIHGGEMWYDSAESFSTFPQLGVHSVHSPAGCLVKLTGFSGDDELLCTLAIRQCLG